MPDLLTAIGHLGARRSFDLVDLVTPDARDRVKAEANRWIKQFRLVDYDGRSMRQRFTYRGDSLWWFTEIYLHKTRVFERAIETLIALEAMTNAEAPARIDVQSADPVVRDAAGAFGRRHGIPVEVAGAARDHRDDRLLGFAVGPAAILSRLGRRRPRAARPRVAAFVHTAFWRDEQAQASGGRESYVGPVLDEIARHVGQSALATVGLGPRRSFRSRRWWDPFVRTGPAITSIQDLAPAAAIRDSMTFWRGRAAAANAIVAGPAIRAAASWRDYDLWPTVSTVLRRVATVQWPWSVRSMDEARAALNALRPDVAVTYAEAGGWGRALMLETRRAGIPSAGLQHGFIYRHWLNYQHEMDEMLADGNDDGFPRPDVTLVFDGYARESLVGAGHFPERSVRITGSPRLDELATRVRATADRRQETRATLGVAADEHLILLVAKHSEIARELPEIVAATEAASGVHLIIKAHPAEPPSVYAPAVGRSRRARVAPADADLGLLLAAADAVVTNNSTAAVDAMALGIPAIVVGLPNNLSPFVEAGVMAGQASGGFQAALGTVLYDRAARERLVEGGREFAGRHQMRADGDAATRTALAVVSLADRPAGPPPARPGSVR
jgi:hypothetical protein